MPGKTVPMSVRLSDDDAAFLARLSIAGAVTPSEKLRALLAEARRRHEGREAYASCVSVIDDMLGPTLQRVRELEYRQHVHSEFLAELYAWLPPAAALAMIGTHADGEREVDLAALEAGLADRVFALIEAVLRLGITARGPCYDPDLIANRLDRVLELTDLVRTNRNRGERRTE